MDKIISKIAALGIPGIVLFIAIKATGLSGAAAITSALSGLGTPGMMGGMIFLGACVLVIDSVARRLFASAYLKKIRQLYALDETKDKLRRKIGRYPVSGDLKRRLREELNNLPEHRK